ncbi:hypothetical protein IE81DRAFT_350340 [Ceraceosorus guamensis]|uniref:Uncharacterized protein n=1 Tax=Ceraceosorus guamensis TaxID=1522189 RepID=A0A316VPJ2_9BASI|nr:hypothetical protein IE81DRAFT_350340 [Ceraceosorus guamensis]PWN39250.1 hypothetical protein IE81DRAFT_350340 [Ceraceosorus guamensis]
MSSSNCTRAKLNNLDEANKHGRRHAKEEAGGEKLLTCCTKKVAWWAARLVVALRSGLSKSKINELQATETIQSKGSKWRIVEGRSEVKSAESLTAIVRMRWERAAPSAASTSLASVSRISGAAYPDQLLDWPSLSHLQVDWERPAFIAAHQGTCPKLTFAFLQEEQDAGGAGEPTLDTALCGHVEPSNHAASPIVPTQWLQAPQSLGTPQSLQPPQLFDPRPPFEPRQTTEVLTIVRHRFEWQPHHNLKLVLWIAQEWEQVDYFVRCRYNTDDIVPPTTWGAQAHISVFGSQGWLTASECLDVIRPHARFLALNAASHDQALSVHAKIMPISLLQAYYKLAIIN